MAVSLGKERADEMANTRRAIVRAVDERLFGGREPMQELWL